MKAVFYYSEQQSEHIRQMATYGSRNKLLNKKVNGSYYTEVQTHFKDEDDVPLKNNFPDSRIVEIIENLPVDDIVFQRTGNMVASGWTEFV